MANTYSDALIINRDKVRFLIQDTDSNDWLMSDGEIDYVISVESTTMSAAARCCQILATKFARFVDSHIGSLSLAASKKFDHYQSLYADLSIQAAMGGVRPYMPAGSIAEKQSEEQNTDRVPPFFGREVLRNPLVNTSPPVTSDSQMAV